MDIKKLDKLNNWFENPQETLLIAGPCSAESEKQVMDTARKIAASGQATLFRSGIWKPRTRPGSFEGIGETALPWLQKVKKETGMLVTTEVANAYHTEQALKHDIDVLWVGARTTVNPFGVQEIAEVLRGVDIPVLVKNPIHPELALWEGALERFSRVGIDKLAAIHRGFYNPNSAPLRNLPHWEIAAELKLHHKDLPIINDPSHISGRRDLISKICQIALDLNFDGFIIETHNDPSVALSDAAQQVTPESLEQIMNSLQKRPETIEDASFKNQLNDLRKELNYIDDELLKVIAKRVAMVDKIEDYKSLNNVSYYELERLSEIMISRKEKGESIGLNPAFVEDIYRILFRNSLRLESEIE